MSKKTLQQLTIKDNFMFGAVMADEENCRLFLEQVLGFSIEKAVVDKEKSIFYNPQYKSVRLDVYARDEKNTCYNVEMQALKEADLPRRTRYYHSQMDMDLLLSGQDYEELSDTYVIFVCDFDPFGRALYKYSFENRCTECPELFHEDGSHTVYLSTRGKNEAEVSDSLVKFLHFVSAGLEESDQDYADPLVSRLQESIRRVKTDREMETKHMWFELLLRDKYKAGKSEGIAEGKTIGIAEGKILGIATSVLSLLSGYGEVSDELTEKILTEKDPETLNRWLKLSACVDSVAVFEKEIESD